jgi:hypothetical protein
MELPPNQGPNVHAVQQDQVGKWYERMPPHHWLELEANELTMEQSTKAAAIQHARRSGSPEPYKRRVSVKRRPSSVKVGDDYFAVSHKRPNPGSGSFVDDIIAVTDQRHRGFHRTYERNLGLSDESYVDLFRNFMFGNAPGGDRRREPGRNSGTIPSVRGSSGVGDYTWDEDNHLPGDPYFFPQNPGFYKGFGPFK